MADSHWRLRQPRFRRVPSCVVGRSLADFHARVENRVQEIYYEVSEDDERGTDKGDRGDDRQVEVTNGGDRHLPQALQGEDALGDDCATQQGGDVQARG